MRKQLVYILIILTIICGKSYACYINDKYYTAGDYFMFRACGNDMDGSVATNSPQDTSTYENNCKLWSSLTSRNIPIDDIYEVVYIWNFDLIQSLNEATVNCVRNFSKNRFASWIVTHGDKEISEFLVTAKQSEHARMEMGSPWYYPVEGDDASTELYEVVGKCEKYEGTKLRDRYLLQHIRALFSLQQYDQCINIWNFNERFFHNDVIKEMAAGYVAGSYYHLGEKEKASKMYIQNGDFWNAYKIADSKDSFLDWIYDVSPDNKILIQNIQREIHNVECVQHNNYIDTQDIKDYKKIYTFIQKIIQTHRCKQMAPWYYAGAFVADKLSETQKATEYIEKAKNALPTGDLYKSIRILDIYLKVKYTNEYTQDFENWIYQELIWMDKQISSNLTDKIKHELSTRGIYNHVFAISQYYWNDIMRKIVISELVPLCIKSGYKIRALQYLNMAENRMYVPKQTLYCDTDEDRIHITMRAYHKTEYRNDYFINLDSIGVEYLKALSIRMQHPLCPLDRFLTSRSYNDQQFLYEIIGTQLIALRKYEEACKYLDKVTPKFNISRNIYNYCNIDPFTGEKYSQPDDRYKLHFAQKMCELERRIKESKDPNDKAETMLIYARGLQRSVGEQCWPLTNYYWGTWNHYPFYSQYRKSIITNIIEDASTIKDKAFTLFTNDERAARAYYDWDMFKTAATKYKDTQIAKFLIGKCDNLQDYNDSHQSLLSHYLLENDLY